MCHSERSEESLSYYKLRDSSVASLLQNDIIIFLSQARQILSTSVCFNFVQREFLKNQTLLRLQDYYIIVNIRKFFNL